MKRYLLTLSVSIALSSLAIAGGYKPARGPTSGISSKVKSPTVRNTRVSAGRTYSRTEPAPPFDSYAVYARVNGDLVYLKSYPTLGHARIACPEGGVIVGETILK